MSVQRTLDTWDPIGPRPGNTRGTSPLYAVVASRVAAQIAERNMTPGDRLPSERTMCAEFSVSRVTLRAGLASLVEQGAIESRAARGWFVAGSRVDTPAGSLQSFTDAARAYGLNVSSIVRLCHVRPATWDEATALRIGPGAAVFELRRIRLLNGLRVAIDHTRIPHALVPGLETKDFATASLYDSLRSMNPAVVPAVADYSVDAVQASSEDAALLEAAVGDPLLLATQTTFDTEGRPIELGRTLYRGDRYRFRARIAAISQGAGRV